MLRDSTTIHPSPDDQQPAPLLRSVGRYYRNPTADGWKQRSKKPIPYSLCVDSPDFRVSHAQSMDTITITPTRALI